MPIFVFILLSIVFVALLLWAEHTENGRLRWIAKPAASACFVLTALAAGAFESVYGLWVLAALILCMAGDIFLISSSERSFLAGMGAFAAGHGAYIGAFLSDGPAPDWLFVASILGMMAFAGLTLRWLWPHLGRFRWPVAAYSGIIAVMVATSVLAAPPSTPPPALWVIVGAVGFAVSDLSVARQQFVRHAFVNKVWGLPLYFGAQLILAASV
ncbi:MAG: lysoplasmalogenase [Pseudomonadota bacterium]